MYIYIYVHTHTYERILDTFSRVAPRNPIVILQHFHALSFVHVYCPIK